MYRIIPTLIVGLGGTGRIALLEIKRILVEKGYIDSHYDFPLIKLFSIDTEFLTSSSINVTDDESVNQDYAQEYIDKYYASVALDHTETESIKVNKSVMQKLLSKPGDYGFGDFLDTETNLSRIVEAVKGHGAGGYGVVGKVALYHNIAHVTSKIAAIIRGLRDTNLINKQLLQFYSEKYEPHIDGKLFNVFVITSLGGGTGKGIFLPIGTIINEILIQAHSEVADDSMRFLINFMPSCFELSGRNVGGFLTTIYENQYASFKELEFVLNNGCPIEETLLQTLNLDADRKKSKEIFTHVLNVGALNTETKNNVGDYQVINQLLAETVINFIYGGVEQHARTSGFTSNREAMVRPITEIEASNAHRCISYGRIGGYKLRYPVKKLFAYANYFLTKEVLEDIVKGDLSRISHEKKEYPSTYGLRLGEEYVKKIEGIYSAIAFIDYSAANKLFTQNIQDDLLEQFRNRYAVLEKYTKRTESKPSELEIQENQTIKYLFYDAGKAGDREMTLVECLQDYAKEYGLLDANEILKTVTSQFEKYGYERHANEIIELSSSTFVKADSLEINSPIFSKIQNKLGKKLESLNAEFEKSYLGGTSQVYANLQKRINNDRVKWETNRTFWDKIGIKKEEAKNISENTINYLNGLVDEATKLFGRIQALTRTLSTLRALLKAFNEIKSLQNNILSNATMLMETDEQETVKKDEVTGGLIKKYIDRMDAIIRTPPKDLEMWIIHQTHKEFQKFALGLRFKEITPILDYVQDQLNRDFMNRVITEIVKPEEFVRVVEDEVKVVNDSISEESICGYLGKKDDYFRKQKINLLTDISAFLGNVVRDKVNRKSGFVDFPQVKVIRARDVNLIKNILLKNQEDDDFQCSFTNDPEIIEVTRLETGLPLCVFEEVHKAKVFHDTLSKSENAKMHLLEKHTSKFFLNVEAPIGNSHQIPAEDLPTFFNLLLHIGVLHFTNDGFVQIVRNEYKKERYEYFYDTKLDPNSYIEEERLLPRDSFCQRFNSENEWYILFMEKLKNRLLKVFLHNRNDSKEYIKRYFTYEKGGEKHFPYIPDSIFSYIWGEISEATDKLSKQFKIFVVQNNLRVANVAKIRQLKKKQKDIPICQNLHDARKYYAIPQMQFFHPADLSEILFDVLNKANDELVEELTESDFLGYLGTHSHQLAKLSFRCDAMDDFKPVVGSEYEEISPSGQPKEPTKEFYWISQKEDPEPVQISVAQIIELIKREIEFKVTHAKDTPWKDWREYDEIADALLQTKQVDEEGPLAADWN